MQGRSFPDNAHRTGRLHFSIKLKTPRLERRASRDPSVIHCITRLYGEIFKVSGVSTLRFKVLCQGLLFSARGGLFGTWSQDIFFR